MTVPELVSGSPDVGATVGPIAGRLGDGGRMTVAERVGFIGGDLDLTMLEDEAAVRLARKAPDSLEGTG